jgi:para-aminobenzoate synthetase component 1
MTINTFKNKINNYTQNSIPYLFVLDFELEKPFICKLDELKKHNILYEINGKANFKSNFDYSESIPLETTKISKNKYQKAFKLVQKNILNGNSYLLNLTFPTKIKTELTLKELFFSAKSSNKIFFKNEFISFSPECFIKIKENKIYTFPMKGTINAEIPNAKKIILNDKKEIYEHNTIVDLMRNDLAMVSTKVKINQFRFIDKIKTSKENILQVSSEIEGTLPSNWKSNFGDLLLKLLPAGSISGAPKQKTIEIIKQAEDQKRGYYTGIFGVFDGENVDTAVLIRFIENQLKDSKSEFIYRSGGGITALSNLDDEYKEILQKIYIPI